MKLLVFGATGATGTLVVQQALEKGFDVTAFVRNPAKVKNRHARLKLAQGDVLQQSTVNPAVKGHDAVICCLGAPATSPGQLRSSGTKNIIDAMKAGGLSRLICQTSLGFDDSEPVLQYTPVFFRKIFVPYLLKKTFRDHSLQESYIRQSSLDWTIIRPGTLTNGGYTGKYREGFDYTDNTLQVKISRADMADSMIRQLLSLRHNRQVIPVSY